MFSLSHFHHVVMPELQPYATGGITACANKQTGVSYKLSGVFIELVVYFHVELFWSGEKKNINCQMFSVYFG